MTTFANPFAPLSTMQAQEDSMEVSTDQERKNLMVMEEDNLDIDLELDDGPQQGQDEDSMMDADPEDGQTHPDGDQQMDDDFQETRDQDDEILDFADQADASVELPMTEDVPQTSASLDINQPPQIFPDLPSQTPQSLPLDTQTLHQPQNIDASVPQSSAIDLAPQFPDITANEAKNDLSQSEHIESIRNLFEDAQPTQGQDTSTYSENPETEENQDSKPVDDVQNVPGKTDQQKEQTAETQDKAKEDRAQPIGNVVEEAVINALETSDDHKDHKDDAAEDVAAPQTQEAQNTVHIPSEDEAHPSHEGPSNEMASKAGETRGSSDHHDDEELTVDISGIVVTCQGQQMSLFPPLQEHGTPDTYLLSDSQLAGESIRSLLSACGNLLADSIDDHEELELLVPLLKLSFTESVTEAEHYSIRDLSDLHYQLHQNDGIEQPESLHVVLEVRTRLSGHIDNLYTLAAEGKGLKFFRETFKSIDTTDGNPSATTQNGIESAPQDQNEPEPELSRPVNLEDNGEVERPDLVPNLLDHEDGQEKEGEQRRVLQGDSLEEAEKTTRSGDEEEKDKTYDGHDLPEEEQETGSYDYEEDHVGELVSGETNEDFQINSTEAEVEESVAPTGAVLHEVAGPTDGADFDTLEHVSTQHQDSLSLSKPSELHSNPAGQGTANTETTSAAAIDKARDHQIDQAADNSEASSSTAREPYETGANLENFDVDNAEAEDFFGAEFDDVDNNDDELNGESNHLDFGLDEQQPVTPQSLKRSRTAADEAGEDAEDEYGHQLKRTRSG